MALQFPEENCLLAGKPVFGAEYLCAQSVTKYVAFYLGLQISKVGIVNRY